MSKYIGSVGAGLITVFVLAGGVALWCFAADHRDGPIFSNTAMAGQFDVNDIYVFQSPADPNNTVFVITVSPFAGIVTPATFDPGITLDLKVDRNGDAKDDLTFRTRFSRPDGDGTQTVTLKLGNKTIAKGATNTNLTVKGGGTFRAGFQDDPFFFDAVGFGQLLNGGAFPRPVGTATDFFGPNVNTLAVVIEIPSSRLNDSRDTNIGVWARLIRDGRQVDRMGFPAINTAVMPPIPRGSNFPIGQGGENRQERRNAFNENTKPWRDLQKFGIDGISVLTNFWGRSVADSLELGMFVLPDILPFDTSSAAGFPNGRRLRDDVIDIELALLTNNAITTDNVPDSNGTRLTDGEMGTIAAFPYLGAPNNPGQGLP